jgi:aminomuconate-semialdehyde/2-hydroxymuconate-6-semialdehyde dehydrogenase
MYIIKNYIGGDWKAAESGGHLDIYDPSCGKVYAKAPDSDDNDVLSAIASAEQARLGWKNTSIHERSNILNKIAAGIDARFEELARAESLDNGKPIWLAQKVDIPRAASNMRFFANAILQFSNDSYDMDGHALNYTLRHPLGIVTCISPWNLPLYLFTWKIAPALAAGNCVIAKPSEVTPMTAHLLTEICHEAGLPAGVLNVIHGLGHKVGPTMSTHSKIKAISFTGSTMTGEIIAKAAAPLFKKLSLEMGGKNPNVILDDCNYDKALSVTMRSSFANQGQICLCGSRVYIQKGIYERFRDDLVAKTKALKVGPPDAADTKVGAVVSEQHMNKILSFFDVAKEEGGKILTGGQRVILEGEHKDGYYIAPTIIEGLGPNCKTNQEEIFGPVITIAPFDTIEEAVELANSTQYGLAASVWTQDIDKSNYLSRNIEAGIVWVNTWLMRDLRTPFGGVKNSGVGREGGYEALRFFTEVKNVCIGGQQL